MKNPTFIHNSPLFFLLPNSLTCGIHNLSSSPTPSTPRHPWGRTAWAPSRHPPLSRGAATCSAEPGACTVTVHHLIYWPVLLALWTRTRSLCWPTLPSTALRRSGSHFISMPRSVVTRHSTRARSPPGHRALVAASRPLGSRPRLDWGAGEEAERYRAELAW